MSSVISEVLVGRDADLARLDEAFREASMGSQRTVVISGEAGIGKSRLISEFLSRLDGRADVVLGNCYASQELAPYLPIRQILRSLPLTLGTDRFDAAIAPVARTLAGLLPGGGAADDPLSPERVHEGLDLLLENLSEERPLVVVIEDLHWVDPSTLGFLSAVLRYRTTGKRLLILSYRSDDVGRGHPLRSFLADVDRGRLAMRIEPGHLSRDAIDRLGGEILGRALTAAELDRVTERSDGIPFFVEELLGLADDQLPDNLRELVLARYDRMSEATRYVLRILAAGGEVDHRLLSEVTARLGIDAAVVETALREALAGGILAIADDTYAFRHALSREAVADEVLPGERDRIHLAYAEAMGTSDDMRLAGEAARHWLAAHEHERAFSAYLAALADARATYAYETQAAILEQLVELWPAVPDAAERAGFTRGLALVTAASAWEQAGRGGRTQTVLGVAESLLEPDDRRGLGELRRVQLGLATTQRRFEGARSIGIEAVELLSEYEDADARYGLARVHANLSSIFTALGDTINARHHAEEAMRVAQLAGNLAAESYVRGSLATEAADKGDDETILKLVEWARSHPLSSPESELRLGLNTLDSLHRAGRFAEAVEFGYERLARAEQLGHSRSWGSLIAGNLADDLAALGRLTESRSLAERALTQGPAADFAAYALRQLVRLDVLMDRPDSAADRLRKNQRLVEDGERAVSEERWGFAVVRAEHAVLRQQPHAGWDALRPLQDEIDLVMPSEAIYLLVAGCEVHAALRASGEDTETVGAFIRSTLGRLHPAARSERWKALAAAELTGDGRDPELWETAALAFDHPSMHRWMLAPVLRHHAAALAERGQRDAARDAISRSIDVARDIGAARDVRLGRELAARLGDGRNSGARAPGSLTARELEVLAAVSEGLSNREIGERLYMSPKTVSVHVSAILRKLGASTRTDAAIRGAALLAKP